MRPAVKDDLDAIVEIYRECFPASGRARLGPRTTRRYFDGVTASPAYRLFAAEKDGAVTGFAVLVVSREGLVGRKWLLADGGVRREIASLSLRRPRHVFAAVAEALRQRFAPPRVALSAEYERFDGARAVWIEYIGVRQSERSRGLGARFIDEIVEAARRDGFECVKLRVDRRNERARRFYEREGFVVTAETRRELTCAKGPL
jgi:ribosomal protein S18 acetylase RimI-like enzyme